MFVCNDNAFAVVTVRSQSQDARRDKIIEHAARLQPEWCICINQHVTLNDILNKIRDRRGFPAWVGWQECTSAAEFCRILGPGGDTDLLYGCFGEAPPALRALPAAAPPPQVRMQMPDPPGDLLSQAEIDSYMQRFEAMEVSQVPQPPRLIPLPSPRSVGDRVADLGVRMVDAAARARDRWIDLEDAIAFQGLAHNFESPDNRQLNPNWPNQDSIVVLRRPPSPPRSGVMTAGSQRRAAAERVRNMIQSNQLGARVHQEVQRESPAAAVLSRTRDESDNTDAMPMTAEANTCMICMTAHVTTAVLPCRHYLYCNHCITKWMDNSKTCPMCKQESIATIQLIGHMDVQEECRKRQRDPGHMESVADELEEEARQLRKKALEMRDQQPNSNAQSPP